MRHIGDKRLGARSRAEFLRQQILRGSQASDGVAKVALNLQFRSSPQRPGSRPRASSRFMLAVILLSQSSPARRRQYLGAAMPFNSAAPQDNIDSGLSSGDR